MRTFKLSIRGPARRSFALAGVAAAAAAALATAAAEPAGAVLLEEGPVKATPREEMSPAVGHAPDGSGVWLAWAQSRRGQMEATHVFLETAAGTRRVNPPRTEGFPGSFDGGTLLYTSLGRRETVDIRFYDVASGRFTPVPAGVNTRQFEWLPSRSGRWLAFSRVFYDGREQVILHDMETGNQRVLARARSGNIVFQHVSVSGSHVVWTRCLARCDVFAHDLTTGTTRMLARPGPRAMQWGASVTADGTIYMLRSGRGCGTNARIVRYGPGDPATGTVLKAFPRGVDAWITAPLVHADGTVDVYYDRVVCRTERWDIHKITVAPPTVAQ